MQHLTAHASEECIDSFDWLKPTCRRLHQVWSEGKNELYLPTYAWHNRFEYSKTKLHAYNETPWGGGVGKGYYDKQGDWHGLYAFAFLDSHKNIEPVLGYAFSKIAHLNDNTYLGAGYAILITARPDIFNNIPFPGVLPWIILGYRGVSVSAGYIPGSYGTGNVLFLVTRITL
jgi:palmitoyl transferase